MGREELNAVLARLLTVEAAASRAGVSARTIANWVAKGYLSPVKIGWGSRISLDELNALLAKRGGKAFPVATEGNANVEQR